jgi:DNA-binding MarR family transcriptional regulator
MPESMQRRRQNLITLFQRASHVMSVELIARLTAAGFPHLRPAFSRVFENLDPEGTRLIDLAERAQMTHQSMSELVVGLEHRGYVERLPDPTDHRARLVCLTPKGRELLRLAVAEIAQIEQAWLRRLDQHGQRELLATLTNLVQEQEDRLKGIGELPL